MQSTRVSRQTTLRVLSVDELVSPSYGMVKIDLVLELHTLTMYRLPSYFSHEGDG